MKIIKEGFLDPEQLKTIYKNCQNFAHMCEQGDSPKYAFYHSIEHPEGGEINGFHGRSIIKDVIPSLIQRKQSEKVKIIDVGAGACLYTEQIRKEFGDKVDVYSTGLRKKTAKQEREKIQAGESPDFEEIRYITPHEGRIFWTPSTSLHPNDLKWRSILELSKHPEFDLILDTNGELRSAVNNLDYLKKYLSAVIIKLNSQGVASLAGVNLKHDNLFRQISEELSGERPEQSLTSEAKLELLNRLLSKLQQRENNSFAFETALHKEFIQLTILKN